MRCVKTPARCWSGDLEENNGYDAHVLCKPHKAVWGDEAKVTFKTNPSRRVTCY